MVFLLDGLDRCCCIFRCKYMYRYAALCPACSWLFSDIRYPYYLMRGSLSAVGSPKASQPLPTAHKHGFFLIEKKVDCGGAEFVRTPIIFFKIFGPVCVSCIMVYQVYYTWYEIIHTLYNSTQIDGNNVLKKLIRSYSYVKGL